MNTNEVLIVANFKHDGVEGTANISFEGTQAQFKEALAKVKTHIKNPYKKITLPTEAVQILDKIFTDTSKNFISQTITTDVVFQWNDLHDLRTLFTKSFPNSTFHITNDYNAIFNQEVK